MISTYNVLLREEKTAIVLKPTFCKISLFCCKEKLPWWVFENYTNPWVQCSFTRSHSILCSLHRKIVFDSLFVPMTCLVTGSWYLIIPDNESRCGFHLEVCALDVIESAWLLPWLSATLAPVCGRAWAGQSLLWLRAFPIGKIDDCLFPVEAHIEPSNTI